MCGFLFSYTSLDCECRDGRETVDNSIGHEECDLYIMQLAWKLHIDNNNIPLDLLHTRVGQLFLLHSVDTGCYI